MLDAPHPIGVGMLAAAAAALCLAAPASAAVRGVDVSRFQGGIDWALVGETKVGFAYVQASRGSGDDCLVKPRRCGADNFYERNYQGATENGIRAGAYHRGFASGSTPRAARADARAEALLFLRSAGTIRRGDLRPVLDVEAPFADLDQRRLRLWVRTWLERVKRKTGVKPMIYTNSSSWQATGDTQYFARRGYKLWIANFGVDSPAVPASGWAGLGWSVWQFTSTGSVRGIQGDVDKNRLGVPIAKITARPRR